MVWLLCSLIRVYLNISEVVIDSEKASRKSEKGTNDQITI